MRLIDADALKNDFCAMKFPTDRINVIELINEQPTITAEQKRGRWIPVTNGRGGHECDQCHNYSPSYQTGKEHLSDYCPNCGARMDGESEVHDDDER